MLKVLSGAAILALTASQGFAADLQPRAPVKAPVAPVQFTWTGCFVGGHLGGAFSQDKIRSSGDFSSAGVVGGGQIGCDYQFASAWVVGVEGRAAWSSLKSDTPGTVTNLITGLTVPTHFTVRNDVLASATARLGYSVADRWLAYVRGGAAWTQEKADNAFTRANGIPVDPSATMTRTGWTAGAGLDWAFAPHWSVNLEYNYYDFGNNDFRLTDPATGVFTLGSLKDRIQTVTAGVNYHF